MVALGVAFGVLIGKELFGGTGRNIFNPALVGRCFLSLAYPKTMAASWASISFVEPGSLETGGVIRPEALHINRVAMTSANSPLWYFSTNTCRIRLPLVVKGR